MTEYEVLYDGSRNCLRCGAGMSKEDDPHRHRCDTTAPLLRAERDRLRTERNQLWLERNDLKHASDATLGMMKTMEITIARIAAERDELKKSLDAMRAERDLLRECY